VSKGAALLKFRCTGCGNCCKDPLLPLTDSDVRRIVARTGDSAASLVRWVDKHGIDMDDEPEAFVTLRQGKRVMVLRHEGGGCRYLGDDNRCTIYTSRPLGCRVFPFDPVFTRRGELRHLRLIQATDCPYELDGHTELEGLRTLQEQYETATRTYHAKVATWNSEQKQRLRHGKPAHTAREYLHYLGFS
jgi:Fe-S-cluster containining protein